MNKDVVQFLEPQITEHRYRIHRRSCAGRWRILLSHASRFLDVDIMDIRVKAEPVEQEVEAVDAQPASPHPEGEADADLETAVEMILSVCKKSARGVSDKQLKKECPFGVTVIAEAINKLLERESIVLLKQGSQLLYRLRDEDRNRGADEEERVVYAIIADDGNKGIWLRDIRFKSNLSMTALNKVIKAMEGKKSIKAIKSVTASKKKVYMLYNLDPDRSVTGGAWYSSDQDFEAEFVDVLSQTCLSYLNERMNKAKDIALASARLRSASATCYEVLDYIDSLKISKVKLSKDEIQAILQSLIYDGQVEQTVVPALDGITKAYRVSRPYVQSTGLMHMPCGTCPVLSDCHDEGEITPLKCIYFEDWF